MKIDFLIVGAQKSGTTALHKILDSHSLIEAPYELKDKKIYNEDSSINHEQIFKKKSFLLASNVNYCRDIAALKLAKKNNPNVKIIFIYRDPIERIISAFTYAKERSLISNQSKLVAFLDENIDYKNTFIKNQLSFLDLSKYGKIVSNLVSTFNSSQIIICRYEFFKNNPKEFLKRLQINLNLKRIENLENIKINVTKGGYYFEFISKILFNKNDFLRKLLVTILNIIGIKQKKKLRDFIRKLNQKKVSKYKISQDELNLIKVKLKSDQDMFYNVLNDLPNINKVIDE